MLRRHILQGLMAAPWVWSLNHLAHAVTSPAAGRRVVVVGSGAFGGWAALNLARGGADVTLVEAWAAGHPRSSSGGETRVIRHMYANPLYARMVARSLALFARAERDWRETLLHRSGVLFMGQAAAAEYFEAGTAALREHQIAFEHLDREAVAARWPQIAANGIEQATFEPQSGYLLARRSCHAVVQAFQRAGGRVVRGRATPGPMHSERLESVRLENGETIAGDDFVFACGPWMPRLFPDLLEPLLTTSRQEVYYFGTPAGDRAHDEAGSRYGPTSASASGTAFPAASDADSRSPTIRTANPSTRKAPIARRLATAWRQRETTSQRAFGHSPTRRWSTPGSASTPIPPTATSSSTSIRRRPISGCLAADPATASSTVPR